MKFSIIIPAFNAAGHIRRALDSVKAQTYSDYELIVVCDSCSDDTAAIASEYGAVVNTVNYHRDGLTRNRGIDIAKGEYILFLDDDDWWVHEYVLQMLSDMIDISPVEVICFSFIFKGRGYMRPLDNRGSYWIAVWNKCWKRSFIADTRFSDKWSVSDVDFHTKMFSKNPTVVIYDSLMYYYNYMRPGSISERGKVDYECK